MKSVGGKSRRDAGGDASVSGDDRTEELGKAVVGPQNQHDGYEGRTEKRKVGLQFLAHDFPLFQGED